jgi:prepilin-type N-terminal cleavage/methylation domain-containing protein/prepilin-type processing-associated H-X9-DG protein
MKKGKKGFTLIELLVVIAIIAILAAMLFPVFARARESARKIQCLSNVKNIAMAVQMYLTDYDRFPPAEHRSEVVQWFSDCAGCDDGGTCHGTQANPYLRWPVILDEYIKNRDVWRCPSARFVKTFGVNPCIPDWWSAYLANPGYQSCSPMVCSTPFPPGWGGTVTDTLVQGVCGGPNSGGFDQSIGVNKTALDLKTGQMNNPSRYVVVADAGTLCNDLDRVSWIAYPDTCREECASCYPGGLADWTNCADSRECGAGDPRFQTDVQYRKDHAPSRHLGGSNIGYADGHAAWMASEMILFGGEPWNLSHDWAVGLPKPTEPPLLEGPGICGWGPPNYR